MSEMFGTYTWLVILVAVLALLVIARLLLKWYWKHQTLPPNKLLFNAHFSLSYNDVFNDLSCAKTDWRNLYRMKDFSRMILDLGDKKNLRFKGLFTSLKFSSLVTVSKRIEKLLSENEALLNSGTGMQDESVIQFYQAHKDQFERYDDVFSSFLKNVTDVPKPVKEETW